MSRVVIVLEYDGSRYHGFQRQITPYGERSNTIQGELEKAIELIVRERVPVLGAGRTDAGVHARGQVASFRAPEQWRVPIERVPLALNSILPRDIVLIDALIAPDDFHPRRDAKSKVYSYTFFVRDVPSPFLSSTALFIRGDENTLDLDAMRAAARLMKGTHDFSAFRTTGSTAKTTVRTVFECDILKEQLSSGFLLKVIVEANGFLYNMARIIAGTLLRVGMKKTSSDEVIGALEKGDKRLSGPTLPARGLCLEIVKYEGLTVPGHYTRMTMCLGREGGLYV
jgi:tRNA pseudouridine38-40 synthase